MQMQTVINKNYIFSEEWKKITLCAKIEKKKKKAAQLKKNKRVRAFVKKKVL
jgi:hypothetical protein